MVNSRTPVTSTDMASSAPAIVAKGGFSGLFPDSSSDAFKFALMDVSKGRKNSVNGVQTRGWFPVDYNVGDLANNVSLTQGIYSRTDKFDANFYPILGVEDVAQFKPSGYWLNVQHDLFYTQHNLSMRSFVLSVSKRIIVDYISSPEVGFLSSIVKRFTGSKTKLVFRFLGEDIREPSTNQTYSSLLKNLTFIKTFASGILIPKNYIWPLTPDLYLQPHTSVVTDAHKVGLEVFASDFANDAVIAYNYSYDPLAEYLKFVDNGNFSVDGVLTDFPITPAEAIGCYSHISKNSSGLGKPVIISHNGASGIYPGCTDLAYKQAVSDGADFIDCPVQMTQDGILVCMSSINLMEDTTVTKSLFNTRLSTIPEIQSTPGIFTFNLTWEEIQSLKPMISNPQVKFILERNPRYKNAGSFMTLSSFLAFAKDKQLSGVLISIENAAFLAERLAFSVTDAVISALSDSGYNNQTTQEVIIQSSYSSVLVKVKQQTKYKLQYMVDESIHPYVEVTTFVEGAGVDGVITDFPGTASLYRRNGCANLGNNTPIYMEPVQVGLIGLINPKVEPPALAPLPVLDLADVVEPPLPPVAVKPPTPGGSTTPPPSSTPSGGNQCTVPLILISVAVILGSLIFI
ncbi:hypothetical protein J5N97_005368 [Dioscorea zingiberensis]|uniref:glycerophosphodiester phosphodiesterase n=1 Tax=Dioscorea zingiberensis TaxID=325984 RepID=A0A9D5DAL5_9LILI|nr:hypothetical protein J5N97_005368 [Dioscorea zingiberensis]